MDRRTIERLKEIVGPEQVATTREELLCYSFDGTGLEFPPAAVAFPGSAAEVAAIMRLAAATPFPVVPRGAGSGMTGGALPVAGGLVLAMSRLNRILEIDPDNQIAVVEPGVVTGQLREEVGRYGLAYPPDPASLKFCTIGGNIAENAGGPSAVKYGVTRDYVLGLEAVLTDGSLIRTGVRTAKGVTGYDLTRLLIGSEGTLAVITRIILRLIAAPEAKRTFLVLLDDLGPAARLVSGVLGAGLLPCTLEYLDATALGIVASSLPFPLPPAVRAMLLIEVDGERAAVAAQADRLRQLLAGREGVLDLQEATSEAEVKALWTARRAVSPAAFKLKPHKLSEDVVVPRSRIPELVAFTETLNREGGIVVFTFGHAGDGNIHVNIMLDRANPEEVARAAVAKEKLFARVIGLGGTLSGEHGIGLTKAPFLPLEFDEATMAIMRAVKDAFDPHHILNPGKIFPPAAAKKS
ncbi:MAG: FAD-binding protein [Desulfobacteraceae bacterium]|nr:FAD-binding protein [Desulfobacteraceae bacterium]